MECLDEIRLFICACIFAILQLSLPYLSDLNAKLQAFVKAPAVLFDNIRAFANVLNTWLTLSWSLHHWLNSSRFNLLRPLEETAEFITCIHTATLEKLSKERGLVIVFNNYEINLMDLKQDQFWGRTSSIQHLNYRIWKDIGHPDQHWKLREMKFWKCGFPFLKLLTVWIV